MLQSTLQRLFSCTLTQWGTWKLTFLWEDDIYFVATAALIVFLLTFYFFLSVFLLLLLKHLCFSNTDLRSLDRTPRSNGARYFDGKSPEPPSVCPVRSCDTNNLQSAASDSAEARQQKFQQKKKEKEKEEPVTSSILVPVEAAGMVRSKPLGFSHLIH